MGNVTRRYVNIMNGNWLKEPARHERENAKREAPDHE